MVLMVHYALDGTLNAVLDQFYDKSAIDLRVIKSRQ